MEEESSAFVTMIANNLGITPMNWYRSFSQHCEQNDVVKTWAYSNKVFASDSVDSFSSWNKRGQYTSMCPFQNLITQTDIPISELEQ